MSSGGGSFLKQFDIFRKMPRDLTEPTFCGALGKYSNFNNYNQPLF